ncbi:MAG: ribonuclease M5 [Desulfosarcinaceae bacterium]|nr:ribonuclease M5 [Desulfosarcinaceae bacterium]
MAERGDSRSPRPLMLEHIVVEGRADERAVKAAVDAEVIVTSGYGITRVTWERIAAAVHRTGVILFTDPDAAGEQIRRTINQRIPGCKNAYLTRDEAYRQGNIGIENARPAAIQNALHNAHGTALRAGRNAFTLSDLQRHQLIAHPRAARRREALGRHLRIGYANAKQLLRRLNHSGISRRQFEAAAAAVAAEIAPGAKG